MPPQAPKFSKSKYLNPILYLLYYFFKALVELTRRVYYANITVVKKENGRFKNPCIVVSNHPSTVLDPLHAAEEIKTVVYFLANASLFKNPVAGWIFRKLYCIPIERYEDTGGKPLNNRESFEKSTEHIAKGGCLYIAPEGTSYVYRRLRKVKTGTARIALAAESRHQFQLGLTILPIGLNYSDPTKFRSSLLTILGEHIQVADFKADWETDEQEAVRKLTDHIRERLTGLMLDTADETEDKLLRCLEEMMQNEERLPAYPEFLRTQRTLAQLQAWSQTNPASSAEFRTLVFGYFEKLKTLKTSDLAVAQLIQGQQQRLDFLLLMLAFPFFLVGYLSHFLPAFATQQLSRSLNKDIHWEPTYKYITGVVVYPLIICLQVWLVGKGAEALGWGSWVKWLYLLSLVPMGLVADWWLVKWQQWQDRRRMANLKEETPQWWKELASLRERILAIVKPAAGWL